MGGRGSSSGAGGAGGGGGIRGISVNFNGEETTYFFETKNGVNYYSREMGGITQPTPNNVTPKELRERIESNGAKTKTIGQREYKKIKQEYKKDREETNKFLNTSWFKDAPRPRKGMKGH